jgi:hypothetical protein
VWVFKFKLSVAADRRIYAEGMLSLPAGEWGRFRDQVKNEMPEIQGEVNQEIGGGRIL